MSLGVLVQSEMFVQISVLIIVMLMGALMYVFGYKAAFGQSTNDDDISEQQSSEKSKRSSKDLTKKKKKETKPAPVKQIQPVVAPSPPSPVKQEKPIAKKAQPVVVVEAVKPKTKKQSVELKTEPKPVEPVIENNNADGWVTVKDKKQKKTSTPEPTKQADKVKQTKVESQSVVQQKQQQQQAPIEAQKTKEDSDEWITVKDKKQKKTEAAKSVIEASAPQQVVPVVEESKKSKKKKEKSPATEVVPEPVVQAPKPAPVVKVPQPTPVAQVSKPAPVVQASAPVTAAASTLSKKKNKKLSPQDSIETVEPSVKSLELIASSLDELNKKNDDSEWVVANSKATKKNSGNKAAASVAKVEASVQVATTIAAAKPSNPGDSSISPKNKKKKENPQPTVDAQAAIGSSSSPNDIVAAIIDQFKNDNNNNVINKAKQTQKDAIGGISQIKQTNLSESMILIDSIIDSSIAATKINAVNKNASAAAPTKRTESNQSSSDSLQDVDGEEGWATISSKKNKRPVRREQ